MYAGLRRVGRFVVFGALVMLAAAVPVSAQGPERTQDAGKQGILDSPQLSTTSRLDDRRYVTTGDRAYVVGTEAGRFPAMGFHTRGEMGGIWSPPIKLLDGIWFGIDDDWIGPATKFTSGYGHVTMDLPGREGLTVSRTDFVPDGKRAVLFGLTFDAGDSAQSFSLKMDARSELMSTYPWGETNPSQTTFNKPDDVSVQGDNLVFEEQTPPPADNALAHDWAAVVGADRPFTSSETGNGPYRGPQGNVICPASGPDAPEAPKRCDDTEYGKGAGGRLSYDIQVPANGSETVWFAVGGADIDAEGNVPPSGAVNAALDEQAAALADPDAALQAKVADRLALQAQTKLSLPGDPRLQQSIDWSKQNLADSVQSAEDLEIRESNAGKNYPAPEGNVDDVAFLGAGFPDYQWLFGTDGEFTAFASVGVGQFEAIENHLRALRDVSLVDNTENGEFSGKVVHEMVTDGTVYFGSNADAGNTDETAKFPSAVALIWRWTGDDAFRDEMYDFSKANMEYIFRELDEDGDLWPEGLGNVEREGMGEEKLDNTVYTIRGLRDLAEMARSKGDTATEDWALERARAMEAKFEEDWWMPGVPQHADSLDDPDGPTDTTEENTQVQQRHWIGVTPMDVELYKGGRYYPGLATRRHGNAALALRETICYGDSFGLYHTGEPGCDPAESGVPPELNIFTLNTAIMAVGEGNYGRLGEDQQQRFTTANARLQLPNPDEQPGAMPEIAPSPDYGRSINKPFNERAMVLQAWGAYGTIWPVVHQQLGVRPNLGFGNLAFVPQVPEGQPSVSGENIRLGDGSADVTAKASRGTYTTRVSTDGLDADLTIGHTLPRGAKVKSVTLDGKKVRYDARNTNRGKEVTAKAKIGGEHTLVVKTG